MPCLDASFKTILKFIIKDSTYYINGQYLVDFGFPRDEIKINLSSFSGYKIKSLDGFEISNRRDTPFKIQNIYADTAFLLGFDNTYFRNLRLSIYQPLKGSPNETFDGVIGTRILENFIMVIDYKNKSLYLKSYEKEIEIKEDSLISLWGISLRLLPSSTTSTDTTKYKWIVSSIRNETLADLSDIKLWDELQSIDNVILNQISMTNSKNALIKATRLTFRGQNGLLKTLKK